MHRRFVRLTAAALAGVVVLLLAGASLLGLHFQRRLAAAEARFQEQAGPLEPAAYAPPEVADPANIAAWMKAGAAAILLESDDRQLLAELDDLPASKWAEQKRQRVEVLLGELGPALSLLHHGAQLRDASFGLDYAAGSSMAIPGKSGVELLRASSLLAVESRLALARGDVDGAARAARGVERLAATLGHEPILLFAILAEGVSHRYLLLLRSILENDPPEPVLASLAADLSHHEALRAPFARAVAFDATGVYSAFKHGIFEGGIGFRILVTSRFLGPLMAARTLEAFLRLVEWAESSSPAFLASLPGEPPSRVRPWDLHLLLMPNFTDALVKDKATASALELARLAIEARRIGLSDGRYPASLPWPGDHSPAPSPLSGERPLYEPTASGGVRLAFSEAKRLLEERNEDEAHRAELLDWELAPLSP